MDALLRQDYPTDLFEILAVENGSIDGSAKIVEERTGVPCLHAAEVGAYPARNHGIRHARGEILAFTDVDCIPSPDWLSRMERTFRDPGVGLVLGRTSFAGRSWLVDMLAHYENEKAEWVCAGSEGGRYFGYANNMGVRCSWMKTLGGFENLGRGADTVFVQRLIEAAGAAAVRYDAEVHVRHMEIDGLAAWTKKRFVYGRSSHFYGKRAPARPLTVRERIEVLRTVTGRHRCGLPRVVGLCAALSIGLGAFVCGRLTARVLGPA
jgi:glycosyltransferase involved in cell wall biosynthesis